MTKLYDLFWENTKLNNKNASEFSKKLDEFALKENATPSHFEYAGEDFRLGGLPFDTLMANMLKRQSWRTFSSRAVSERKLAFLFSSFVQNNRGTKTYASAGGTYPIEIFCLVNNCKSKLNKKILYYNSDNHSVSVIADLPKWNDYADFLSLDTKNTIPQLVFIFVIVPERTTAKYGDRGGRFALIEVGHAAQNLSLRITKEKMKGVELGGLYDEKIKKMLRLENTSSQIALGFACGY